MATTDLDLKPDMKPVMKGKQLDFSERLARVINPRAYLQVNVPAVSIAICSYLIWITFYNDEPGKFWCWQNILLAYLVGCFRSYFYTFYLYVKFEKRRKYFEEIHKKMEAERTFIGHVMNCMMRLQFSATIMQTCNILGTFYFFGVRDEFDESMPFTVYGCAKKMLIFMIEMFIWEIWFDFGHYWGHRMGHYFKWLYEFGHKYHHENISPDAFDGLNITFDDAMLTNWVPHMMSMFLTTTLIFGGRPFSLFEYFLLSSYKTFVEVTGHVGVDFKGHSFPMFPPLAYYLGIDIGTAAYHSLHHRYYTVNYAKRFTLWDRVFGTMKEPPVLYRKSKKQQNEEIRKVFKDEKKE